MRDYDTFRNLEDMLDRATGLTSRADRDFQESLRAFREIETASISNAMRNAESLAGNITAAMERTAAYRDMLAASLSADIPSGVFEAASRAQLAPLDRTVFEQYRDHADSMSSGLLAQVHAMDDLSKAARGTYSDSVAAAMASVAGILEHSLSAAQGLGVEGLSQLKDLLKLPPFHPDTVAGLRALLGSGVAGSLAGYAELNVRQRMDLQFDSGFRPELVAFPRGKYGKVLKAAKVPEPKSRVILLSQQQPSRLAEIAYRLLFEFENEMRSFIAKKLRDHFGEDWETRCIPQPILAAGEKRRRSDSSPRPGPILYFVDFPQYFEIMMSDENWEACFKEHFKEISFLNEAMRRLNPWRRRVAHVRGGSSKGEILLSRAEIHRLRTAMGIGDALDDVDLS